jgi:hypothetical protein
MGFKQNDCFNHTYRLLSVAVLALPAFPKTWVTSGIDFIILSWTKYSLQN